MDLIGTRLGRLRIDSLIGRGGMGDVYLGFDEGLRRRVAVKTIRAERRLSPSARARFLREARLLSQLDHPGICRVHDLVETPDGEALVMELVEGRTLADAARESLDRSDVLRLAALVADALEVAHEHGVIHRDLKPENVMITAAGTVKVLDFGIARSAGGPVPAPGAIQTSHVPGIDETEGMTDATDRSPADVDTVATFATRDGSMLGTARYMSPEQCAGGQVTVASDMYSFGIMLHELVTGASPYGDASGPGLLLKVSQAETEPISGGDADLSSLVVELESLDARRRPTAGETAQRLRRILDRPARRRRRLLTGVTATVVAAIVVGAAVITVATRLGTRRQMAMAQRFGQTVERVEQILWREHVLPLHDVRPAQDVVRAALLGIGETMAEVGPAAEAPGHAALGRGSLSLGELDTAREHLARARDLGDRSPETAYALGLALGRTYERELQKADRIGNAAARERRISEVRTEYRDPAREMLSLAVGSDIVVPEYLDALIATYDGRLEEALDLARAAFDRVGWLYEAKVLEGYLLSRRADRHWSTGETEAAMATARRADDVLRAALRIGESDPDALRERCTLWSRTLAYQLWNLGTLPQEITDTAIGACRDSLVVDPGRPGSHLALAGIHSTVAEHLLIHGSDPSEALASAEEKARAALLRDESSVVALDVLATVAWQRGKHRLNSGLDPVPDLEEAARRAQRAVAVHPRDFNAVNTLGAVQIELGLWELMTGADPRSSLNGAEEAFATILSLDPDDPIGAVNLGICRHLLLRYEVRHLGRDRPGLVRAAESGLREALEINPEFYWTHRTLGGVLTEAAEADRLAGRDPTLHLEASIAALERAVEINSADQNSHQFLVDAHLVAAAAAIERGEDPEVLLGRATSEIERAAAAGGRGPSALHQARIEMMRARWDRAAGRSPLAAVARVEEVLGDDLRKTAGGADGFGAQLLLAEALMTRGEWLVTHGAATGNIDRLRPAVNALVDRQRENVHVQMLQTRLELLEARSLGDDAAAGDAIGALRRIGNARPGLAREIEEIVGRS